jgi:biotin-(acetyl-CoA carboxylase) ligase
LVIGVGLNVNRLDYPAELSSVATSLLKHKRRQVPEAAAFDRGQVLAQVLLAIERRVDALIEHGAAATAGQVDARLALKGIRVQCGGARGTILGLSERGELRLATESGVIDLLSGHVVPEHPG